MPQFIYTVKDNSGKTIRNTAEAFNEDALVDRLQKQGYFVLNIKSASQERSRPSVKKKTKVFTHKNVNLTDKLVFSHQLALMLDSGVTLLKSLDVLYPQVQSEQFSEILLKVRNNVEQGRTFSESIAQHPKVFNQFWVSLIEVGEAAGTMPLILKKLSSYLEQQAGFRSTIISAMVYPMILFAVCMGAIGFFAFYVAPQFKGIYASSGADLPAITQILLNLFDFLKEKALLIFASITGVVFLLRQYAKTPDGQLRFERLNFRLPMIGELYRLIIVERFTSQMAILIESGVPILHSLDITQRLVNNRNCAIVVGEIREGVREGELLAATMAKTDFFPAMAIQMIAVGEESGELSKMLNHVANFYKGTVETSVKRLSTMIEPLMLVFMGGMIGTIVLAMFMPMFNLSKTVSG